MGVLDLKVLSLGLLRFFKPRRHSGASARPARAAAPKPSGSARLPTEARAWLRGNGNPYPFASNRFKSRDAALAMVESLYRAGASRVRVDGVMKEPERIRSEGGPYATMLLVDCSGTKCAAVQRALKRHQPDRITQRDTGFRVWWD